MKHFNIFDAETFAYLTHLKATNKLWFNALIGCAKRDSKTTRDLINSACKILPHLQMTASKVNVFQICKAVNLGILTEDSLEPYVSDAAWHVFREMNIRKLKDEGWVGK